MVSLDQLRAFMKAQAEEDKNRRRIRASGATLEDALKQASIELGLPLKTIEYEVLEKGSRGTFGLGKKAWTIVAYPARKKDEAVGRDADAGLFPDQSAKAASEDRDGVVSLRLTAEGVLLKVSPPRGRGLRVGEREAVEKITQRYPGRFDGSLVAKVVKYADDEYVKIAEYDHVPINDPVMSVDITDGEMKGFVILHPPGSGGADPSFDSIVSFLQNNGVVSGFQEDLIHELEDNPRYGVPVLVAEGSRPKIGRDAQIVYSFETDTSKVQLKEKNGRVDFKELNLIKNVVEGQVLARKIPPERGESGRTVTGKLLPSKDGQDCDIDVGKNVKLSEDGGSAIAEMNGQVVITAGKINVEPVFVVPGDVNLKTGNILFLGTVMVRGNVDDGFSVKAAGNIEVMGSVGRCDLDAEGDIIVHQGITGKTTGKVLCGRSVWSKFIENSDVEAGEFVVVSDGIINSRIIANRKVLCKGKRASIVGGHLRVAEEINAKTLGSVAGSETILEVGYDPRSKAKFDEMEARHLELEKQLDEVNLNLGTLENLKKVKQVLPEDKQGYYDELTARRAALLGDIDGLRKGMEELKNYLSQLGITGKISASGTVFPGVKVIIKEAVLDVKNEFKAVTFISEGNLVRVSRYEEPEEDLSRKR